MLGSKRHWQSSAAVSAAVRWASRPPRGRAGCPPDSRQDAGATLQLLSATDEANFCVPNCFLRIPLRSSPKQIQMKTAGKGRACYTTSRPVARSGDVRRRPEEYQR